MIFAVRTTTGQERNVAESLASKAEKEGLEIFSILATEDLKGYILVEASNRGAVEELVRKTFKVKGIVPGESSVNELEHLLTPTKIIENIDKGDVIELIAGPFKGEKARVTRVDKNKEEITLELMDAAVPIPITVGIEQVRIVSKTDH
ncbi:MAG: transcription termination/antitermination protein NusG [Methanothermococcus sp.]|jgi:transcriptional antiterminator NusG|uniref:transcription elongation factor Spt5 n=1 Tax=Methanothermococcus TaxID=155862 RepID=UPI00036E932F|nr:MULTISPECIES: transcription elongation factor Spt5 [Methanothermococcus]MDK2789753.1 transcription termination/antitermination protein NusG [Methanothermococcus sp.]MDK2986968.1 transcription termination/antitermination protein NusG [Methanothermococcus sp.]